MTSNSGGGGGPLVPEVGGLRRDCLGWPVLLSSDVVEELASPPSRNLSIAAEGRGLVLSWPMDGRMRRFCFEGGRISSKSTGTPRETRKRRRIRERVQLGGCIGGGETSCCQSERERSERKGVGAAAVLGLGDGCKGSELGRMALM